METKLDFDSAKKEVEKWLDHKKVKPNKREASQDAIDALIDAVMYGQLVLGEDFSWTANLDHPIDSGDAPMGVLVFKPRLKVSETHSKMKGVKPGDADGRVMALIAALTNKPFAMIGKLDTSDYSIAQNIALFFI